MGGPVFEAQRFAADVHREFGIVCLGARARPPLLDPELAQQVEAARVARSEHLAAGLWPTGEIVQRIDTSAGTVAPFEQSDPDAFTLQQSCAIKS
ncbi:MAG: hypothetical protein IT481_04930 [Gammaproteobacteria bacterium]|nr:hypothetical protein [Gammaproteobacteria bacterium]